MKITKSKLSFLETFHAISIATRRERPHTKDLLDMVIEWTREFEAMYKEEPWGKFIEKNELLNIFTKAKSYRKDGYTISDPSNNQLYRYIGKGNWDFLEDRIINPETKETEEFHAIMNLDHYNMTEIRDALRTFGYNYNLDFSNEIMDKLIILECLFELRSYPFKIVN